MRGSIGGSMPTRLLEGNWTALPCMSWQTTCELQCLRFAVLQEVMVGRKSAEERNTLRGDEKQNARKGEGSARCPVPDGPRLTLGSQTSVKSTCS